MRAFLKENLLFFALTIATLATLGSLYFSEIKHFAPCILCWYQRICMYPLIPILLAGIIRQDKKVYWYVLPLSVIGTAIATYHNLLYYKIIPEGISPCQIGVSCTIQYINYFGFITIPLLSLLAFLAITVGMIVYARLQKDD